MSSSSESPPTRPSKLDRFYGSGDTEHGAGTSPYKLSQFGEKDGVPPADALEVDFKHDLHRGLKSRQIAMVMPVVTVELMQCRSRLEELLALDSSLELAVERFMKILITSAALVRAGPAGVLISYILVGFVIYMVMTALGEMSAYLPLPEGFSGCTA